MAQNKCDSHRQNLVASVGYANRLMEQVPKTAVPHGFVVVELALLARLFLEKDIASIDGNEHGTDTALLLQSICGRLGYQLVPANFEVVHYEVELVRGDRSFTTIVSCPVNTDMDAYIPLRFDSEKDKYQSHRIIRKLDPDEAAALVAEKLRNRGDRKPPKPEVADSLARLSNTASPEEVRLIHLIHESGLLEVYGEVVSRRNEKLGQNAPVDLASNFLSFLKTVSVMKLAPRNLKLLIKEFGGIITVHKAQGIAMVVSDGDIKMFLPTDSFFLYVNGLNHPLKLHGVVMKRGGERSESLGSLIRRRAGYVPSNCKVFSEALLHSVGDFGRSMGDVSIQKKL